MPCVSKCFSYTTYQEELSWMAAFSITGKRNTGLEIRSYAAIYDRLRPMYGMIRLIYDHVCLIYESRSPSYLISEAYKATLFAYTSYNK